MPIVTNNGNLLFPQQKPQKNVKFSKAKRFSSYQNESKITGYRVGPGSYNIDYYDIGISNVKGGHVYKNYYRSQDISNNGYLFIGNQIMFDSSFMLPSRKNPVQNLNSRIDATHASRNTYSNNFNSALKKYKSTECETRSVSPLVSRITANRL